MQEKDVLPCTSKAPRSNTWPKILLNLSVSLFKSVCVFVYDYLEKVILLNLSTPLFFSFVEYCKHSSALKTELVLAELVTCL